MSNEEQRVNHAQQRSGPLNGMRFENRLLSRLPVDTVAENYQRQVYSSIASRVRPTSVGHPRTIACSREILELLGLPADACDDEQFAEVFAGNQLLPGMDPYASCYGGHQFGHWAGQLGDGRAINLGETLAGDGRLWTLQLKGAGPTPYSRGADGRAVLRSSIREFLCSEAMHHLGVPTTRALSLVLTGESVVRDMFYDGNPAAEPGAIVCRVAPSFTRFGHFQLLAARGDTVLLQQLMDYTIAADFPHLKEDAGGRRALYLRWFDEVCRLTMEMIAHWQRVGFVHGVMNTDNMSILGLTIDYGPYGWIDDYDPDWTPNTTDAEQRRYRFGQQPAVARWNLYQLANALVTVIGDATEMEQILELSWQSYEQRWHAVLAAKLGLGIFDAATDSELFSKLDLLLQVQETDMTLFFRRLADFDPASPVSLREVVSDAFYDPAATTDAIQGHYRDWEQLYRQRLLNNAAAGRREQMLAANPLYVLRNYLAQAAIDEAEQGNYAMITELLEVLRRPYMQQPGREEFALKRPDWARDRAGCSMLSCSS